jgi:hypothetical protein
MPLASPLLAGISYMAAVDPSGGSSDSFTLSITHRDKDGRGILDVLREVHPPFSPEDVTEEFCALLKSYGVREVRPGGYILRAPSQTSKNCSLNIAWALVMAASSSTQSMTCAGPPIEPDSWIG